MTQPHYDLAIIGAGFAGMYLLHRARSLGLRARVFEAGTGVGGTWYWNRYPGARCDIESLQYSYQFDPTLEQEWQWSERYSPQPEILRYAEHVADRYDLRPDIQFDSRLTRAALDEENGRWTLEINGAGAATSQYVVMATGCLSVPNWPKIDGLERFAGTVVHTALWPHDGVALADKRVAVIGTGSSAIQSIPHIAAQARELTVFQRTPNYSIPAHNGPMDKNHERSVKAEYQTMRARARKTMGGIDGVYNQQPSMDVSAEERLAAFEQRWATGGLTFMGAFGDLMLNPDANSALAEFVRDKIRSAVDDPEVAERLCPTNIIGGKRLCVDSDYYATYNREHVKLVDVREHPIERITETAVVAGGDTFEIDVLIIATGFDAMTGALTAVDIRGRDDASLKERWADGPSSYLGLAMADFPNLFTVTGPGSPSVFTNMLPTIEQHVDWIAACLGYMAERGYRHIEATAEAETAWWAHVQEVAAVGLKSTTDSWYLGANVSGKARVFMPYYGGFPAYCQKCEQVAANQYQGFRFT
ncbi:MAG: NAD(P)/FAD-dependent oxidoreductase [Pseudomonadota bacterium]